MALSDDITAALASLDVATTRLSTVISSARQQAATLQATIDDLTAQLATGLSPAQAQDVITRLQAAVTALNAL